MDKKAIDVCSVIAQHDDKDLHFALLNMLKEFGLQNELASTKSIYLVDYVKTCLPPMGEEKDLSEGEIEN